MATTMIDEIAKLSVEERILLVEEIWDSIIPDADYLPVTAAQEKELKARLVAYEADSNDGSSWPEVKRRIKRKANTQGEKKQIGINKVIAPVGIDT
jgi:putative addiction module component (TIGR02574 family)